MKIKNIKLFILLIFVFFVSGCSVEYNLIINEDSSINEEVVASENINRLEAKTRLKGEQAFNYLYNMFKRDNEDISTNYSEKNSIAYGKARTIHNNIEDFSSKFSSDIFEKVEVLRDEDEITITTIQKNILGGDLGTSYIYDDININITIPFKVLEHNADSVSKNTYTWNIKKNQEEKTIKIVYKDNELPNRANITINNNKYNLKYEYFIIGGIVLTILIIIVFIFIRNKKNNVL